MTNIHDLPVYVETTTYTRTTETGIVLPKRHRGRVLDYNLNSQKLIIDFGLTPLIGISPHSQLIRIVE